MLVGGCSTGSAPVCFSGRDTGYLVYKTEFSMIVVQCIQQRMWTVPLIRTEGGHTCDAVQQYTGHFCSKGLPDYSSL